MPLVTRGRLRGEDRAVPVTASIWYGYSGADLSAIAGVSASDVTALGIKKPSDAGTGIAVVYGCKRPFPAKFRKKIGDGTPDAPTQQGYVSSYGDATSSAQIKAANTAGWRLIKPVQRVSFGTSVKSKNVAVPLSNGLYHVQAIPIGDATEANATLFGWEMTLGDAKAAKAFRACPRMKPAKVVKREGNATKTFPCKWSKTDSAEAAGWKTVSQEFISSGDAVATT